MTKMEPGQWSYGVSQLVKMLQVEAIWMQRRWDFVKVGGRGGRGILAVDSWGAVVESVHSGIDGKRTNNIGIGSK